MKTVTQKDFRDLYPSPDTEKTEEMRRTLAVLPDRKAETRENRETRPVFRKRRVAFILVAALMLIGITALGVGLISGTVVSWGGDQRPFTEGDINLPPQEEIDWISDYLNTCSDDVMTVISWNDSNRSFSKEIQTVIDSEEELLRILEASGLPHPEPLIPDGWTFVGSLVDYSCAPDAHYELVREEEIRNGLYTAGTYSLDEKDRVVTGCTINIEKGSENGTISFGASTRDMITKLNIVYPVEEGVKAGLVSVPGMEEAMLSAYDGFTDIQMYRPLEKPVSVNVNWSSPDTDVWTYDYQSFDYTNVSLEEVVRCFSEAP